jgi:hypothetical protein
MNAPACSHGSLPQQETLRGISEKAPVPQSIASSEYAQAFHCQKSSLSASQGFA